MKPKPTSHKASNTFKFQGFQQKIRSIKVSSRKFILRKDSSDNESITLFWQSILKWRELNLTAEFKEFQKEIGNDCQTVAQLLLNEKRIISTLENHLMKADILAQSPILHVLVALACDIPNIFYKKHFLAFQSNLISLIDVRCQEGLENIFVCFVSLFRTLEKYLKNDIYQVFFEGGFSTLFSKKFPWFIHELASQSVCSLIRKIDNQRYFFTLLFGILKKSEYEPVSVGKLLFHCIKSDAARRLHSSASIIFEILLGLLSEDELPLDESCDALCGCLKNLAFYVTANNVNISVTWQETWKQDSHYIWGAIYRKLAFFYEKDCVSFKDQLILKSYLQVMLTLIQFKKGSLIDDELILMENIFKAIRSAENDDVGKIVSEITSSILSYPSIDKTPTFTNFILANLIECKFSYDVIFDFIKLALQSDIFDDEILPFAIEFIYKTYVNHTNDCYGAILNCLGSIIATKKNIIKTGEDIKDFKSYSLNFSDVMSKKKVCQESRSNCISQIFDSFIHNDVEKCLEYDFENLVLACVCLSHIKPLKSDDYINPLLLIFNDSLEHLDQIPEKLISDWPAELLPHKKKKKIKFSACPVINFNIKPDFSEISSKLLFLISIIIEALHQLLPIKDFISYIKDSKLLSLMLNNIQFRENVNALRSLDIFLTAASLEGDDSIICETNLKNLYFGLAPCLCSYQHNVRLLVAHIFGLFPVQLPPVNIDSFEQRSMFSIMFEAECLSISPYNYKERLRILSQLDSEHIHSCKPLSGIYEQAPLLFLIGQLYINFKELWETVINYIAKYAHYLLENEFWPIWISKLRVSSFMTLKVLCEKTQDSEYKVEFDNTVVNEMHQSYITHPGLGLLNSRIDHLNFRDLLWQCMQQFPDVCERRHHDVVTLFFDFLHKELFPADFNVAPTQDISLHDDDDKLVTVDGEIFEQSTEDENTSCSTDILDANQRIRKAPTKSLCEIMSVFGKFRNPKSIHKAKDLENIYLEFLSHPYLRAQKLALDAMMSYNYKYLNAYSDSLYRILDDKTFKDEITLFNIDGNEEDESSKLLKEEHRSKFMPILMRILFGKMQYKTGGHTTGKSKTGVRKAIVLRFLAGANENELDTFLNLSFDVLMQYIKGSALDIVINVKSNLHPHKVVPLKRLLGALGTLETIFEQIGGLLDTKKPFMLKVILFILCTVVQLLENKKEVCSHFFPLLKSIKQLAMKKVVLFFTNFELYEWTSDEIEAVFLVAVWPSLHRLPDEGIYSPTPLMQLFLCWAENPRYHILLAKHHHEDQSLTPIPFIVNLLNHQKCSTKVINVIYDMFEMLLTKSSIEESGIEDDLPKIPTDNILPIEEEASGLGLNYLSLGEMLVLANKDELLRNLKNKLLALKKGQMVNNRDLMILVRLSEWIKKEEIGLDLLEFIVPLLKKNCVKQNEKIAYLLDTCSRLIKVVQNCEHFLDDFLCMFSSLNGRIARASLCQTVAAVAFKTTNYEKLSQWCINLNAWNLKMVEEIDYEIRLNSYRDVSQYLLDTVLLDEHIALFLIHHNVWVLREVDDLGLKNLSNLCLRHLIELIVRVYENQLELCRKVIEQNLIPLIKMGLRNKNENVRNSFINILCFAVHKCYCFIPRLQDFLQISNLNDPDVDFLTNMSHIQRSRRTRAMTKLADQLNDIPSEGDPSLKKPLKFQTETITEFLLPIVSTFLFKEEYSTDDNLLNASAHCVGALAKKLPWYPYQNLLKYYLKIFSSELKQLKLGVKVVEAILDAFHEEVCDPKDLPIESEVSEDQDEEIISQNVQTELQKIKAQKIFVILTKDIIPKLQKTLSQRSVRDKEHKVNKKKYPEDEDIKRIPLALALIKLLKKLPKRILDANVNNILLKLIAYLQSKSIYIRREARLMLVKVLKELGGQYLSCFVNDLNTILTRGYQSHVMVFTVHAVLAELQNVLLASHIDPCVGDIMDICIDDLFGEKAEEKEVSKITNKVSEARVEKGYSIMGIVAQTVSVNNLECVIIPLKELLNTHNKKIVNKVCSCFQKVANGLDRNVNITVQQKSIFIYGIIKEKIKDLSENKSLKKETKDKSPNLSLYPSHSFLLAPEPKKVSMVPVPSIKTTSHVIVEFALNFLYILLKHGNFSSSDNVHCSLLDSYISIMSECLLSDYQQVSIYALNTILVLIKFPLPSIKLNISGICGKIFIILNKFASSGLTKGKVFELVQLCFKSVACIIKEIKFYDLEEDHIRVLLHYARNNLDDHNQHHSTFIILDAIISRKVKAPELHDLMTVIRELSIISANLNMLDQARCTYLKYMLNYPKKHKQHLASLMFYLSNVSFDVPSGRMSASLMVNDVISKYPRTLFDKNMEINIWFQLTEQLLKEESKEHRLMLQKTLKELYKKSQRKKTLLAKCLLLMKDNPDKSKSENALIIHMSAQSLLAFFENTSAEQNAIIFSNVIPEITSLLHPGRYKINREENDHLNEDILNSLDLALDSLLAVITKIMEIYVTKDNQHNWSNSVGNDLWTYVQEHLLYPNLKIRLRSASLFGKLFGLHPIEEESTPCVASNSEQVNSLIMEFCEQLHTESPVETPLLSQLGLAVTRCLIYLIRQGKKIPIKLTDQEKNTFVAVEDDDIETCSSYIKGAYAVLHRVGVMAYDELRTKAKTSTLRRECLLNLIAGVCQILDTEFKKCKLIVSFVMKHLTRELSDEHLPESLLLHTKEVSVFIQEKLGSAMYNEEMLRVQLSLERKRNKRRAFDKEIIVSNPDIAMQKKAKKQVAKKHSRKRKFAELKLKPNKKRRLRDLAMVAS